MLILRKPYAILLIILTVLSVYYSAIFAEILSIDDKEMAESLLNMESFSLKGVLFPGSAYYFRPLLHLTFIMDKYLWGCHESFMHLENVVIHALNAILVYLISAEFSKRFPGNHLCAPLFAALLFALHPLATEPVNWISGRTDLLAALFILISFYFLLRAIETDSGTSVIVSSVALFMSPLAKESGIFWYPAALFLVYVVSRNANDLFPKDFYKSVQNYFHYYLALTTAPAGYFILRYFALSNRDSSVSLAVKGVVSTENHDVLNKVRILIKVFGFYCKKLIFPLPLNFAITKISNWYVLAGIAGIIMCLYLFYKRDLIASLLVMAAFTVSPALLVPLGRIALAPVAERYLYIPSAFFAMAVTLLGLKRSTAQASASVLLRSLPFLLLLFCGYVTFERNIVWQKNLTIFEDTLHQNPDHFVIRNELANALIAEQRIEEADRIYKKNKGIQNESFSLAAEINRSMTMVRSGDLQGAVLLLKSVNNPKDSPYYADFLQKRIYVNNMIIEKSVKPVSKEAIIKDNLSLMVELQKVTGNPVGFYTVGQQALALGDLQMAYDYFKLAFERAPEGAYYKEPAQKLAQRLKQKLRK